MFVLVACLSLVSMASAEVIITGPAGSSIGGSTFVPSTNVGIRAKATDVSYCAVAQNSSSDKDKGGKQYGSTSGSSTLKQAPSTSTGTAATMDGTTCTDATALDASFI